MKKEIEVEVLDEDIQDELERCSPDGSEGCSQEDFIKFFRRKFESIPPEHAKTARVKLLGYTNWESNYIDLTITTSRTETDEEYEHRCFTEKNRATDHKERELKQLAELKAKYEGKQ